VLPNIANYCNIHQNIGFLFFKYEFIAMNIFHKKPTTAPKMDKQTAQIRNALDLIEIHRFHVE